MNIFGLDIKIAGKENGYVRIGECQKEHEKVTSQIDSLKEHIDTRIEDLKDFLLKAKRWMPVLTVRKALCQEYMTPINSFIKSAVQCVIG